MKRTVETTLDQRRFVSVAALTIAAWPSFAFAQAAPGLGGERQFWYQLLEVVLAVSGSILGFVFTFRVLGKVTQKSRRLELELREKRTAINDEGADQGPAGVDGSVVAVGGERRGLLLVLRFVILDLTVRIWSVIPGAIGYLTNTIPYVVLSITGEESLRDVPSTSLPDVAAWVPPRVVALAFSAVYWTIVLAFGWPLLKDTCNYLGIPVKGLFEPSAPSKNARR